MNARKNYHYLLEDINAAKNPLDVENVVFNADTLEKARNIFYDVTIFKLDSIGNYIESNDNSGVVVRIHCTDWEYSEDENFYNNADLEKYVNDEIADRVYFYQHEMNYSELEAEKLALIY